MVQGEGPTARRIPSPLCSLPIGAAESLFQYSNKAIIGEWYKRPTIQASYSHIPIFRLGHRSGLFYFGGGAMPDETQQILERLARVETKIDLMINARDIAQEALHSVKSAHHRLNEIEDEMKWQRRQIWASLLTAALSFAVAALVAYVKFN